MILLRVRMRGRGMGRGRFLIERVEQRLKKGVKKFEP